VSSEPQVWEQRWVSRKACGANLGDSGGNKGKAPSVVLEARLGAAVGVCREQLVEPIWATVVTKARTTLSLEPRVGAAVLGVEKGLWSQSGRRW
jgi:hypothetical protein